MGNDNNGLRRYYLWLLYRVRTLRPTAEKAFDHEAFRKAPSTPKDFLVVADDEIVKIHIQLETQAKLCNWVK